MEGSNSKDFEELLRTCHEISSQFPDGIVYIGGIAVYLHSINNDKARPYAEFTHDADFYISIADMSDLRDMEEVTSNRRLNKHQLRKRNFDFDIYTERHSALIVPYDQIIANSIIYDQIRLSSLAHLFALKLEAYRDRHSSTKGQKDAKDLIRIAIIAQSNKRAFNPKLAAAYLSDEHLKLLDQISRGPEFLSLSRGNAHQAKTLRGHFKKIVQAVLDL